MFSVMQDFRLALRQMRKAPGFAIAAVLTLALGIGASTAMFTVIDSVLLRPMPYPQANALVTLGQPGRNGDFGATSWPNLQDLRKQSMTLADVAGYIPDLPIVGTLLGIVLGLLLARLLGSLLYGVNVADPLVLAGTSLIAIAVAAVACCVPALRATRADPMTALRAD